MKIENKVNKMMIFSLANFQRILFHQAYPVESKKNCTTCIQRSVNDFDM